jgi:prepilin-type N-terminal cleavage/methylation domain-containing protein
MVGQNTVRRGLTLIELIVVIAIIAVVLALSLVGIQRAREAALRTQNMNNIRQIVLGVHQLADNRQAIKGLTKSHMPPAAYRADTSLFYRLLPIVHGSRGSWRPGMAGEELLEWGTPTVPVYRNPADPTWDLYPVFAKERGKCSYAFNMFALDGSISLVSSLPDGSSQTIALGDKYYASYHPQTRNLYYRVYDPINGEFYGARRATFADRGWNDVIPVTDPVTKTTTASVPGKTFQVRPRLQEVDSRILQTPFSAGLTVGMFDGSTKTLSPSISESVFWALVTPAAGDVAPID